MFPLFPVCRLAVLCYLSDTKVYLKTIDILVEFPEESRLTKQIDHFCHNNNIVAKMTTYLVLNMSLLLPEVLDIALHFVSRKFDNRLTENSVKR